MSIALIDYGAGNVTSVARALARLGAPMRRVSGADDLRGAAAVVLPGVGHFGTLLRRLRDRGLADPLRAALAAGTPFLGICLGLHALHEGSAEAPDEPGLGLLPGRVEALPAGVTTPHMGWNQVRLTAPSRLLQGIPDGAHFYFAHSFAAGVNGVTTAVCEHGRPFAAAVEHEALCAVQFHPEKSGALGARVLQNFLTLVR